MKFLTSLTLLTAALLLSANIAHAGSYVVTKTADTNDGTCDADCSLREAVAAANASSEDDFVLFDPDVFLTPQTIVLTGGEIIIAANGALAILGPGSIKLTIDGNNTSRIFSNSPTAVFLLDAVTLTRGNGQGATNNNSGGALMNNGGAITVRNSVITGNTTSGTAGAFRNSGSGSSAIIDNCVFSNNTSTGSSAGAIQNFSTSTISITNSYFVGNTSGGTGTGGAIQQNGQAWITNTTFYNNTSTSGGALSSNGSYLLLTNVTMTGNNATNNGGGLHRATTNVNGFIRNSIIAGNNGIATSPDVTNSTNGLDSEGNNIIGVVGTSTGWEASDLINTDPLLGPVGQYGGLGMTAPLLVGSPAIDAANDCVLNASCATNNPLLPVTIDQRAEQRGLALAVGNTVDIGAYEVSENLSAYLPNAGLDEPYSQTIAVNGTGFTYTPNGTLPPGVILTTNGNAVVLSGTPVVGGSYTFDIDIASIATPTQTRTEEYSIWVSDDPDHIFVQGRITEEGNPPRDKFTVSVIDSNGFYDSAVVAPFGYFQVEFVIPGSMSVFALSGKNFGLQSIPFIAQGSIVGANIDFSTALRLGSGRSGSTSKNGIVVVKEANGEMKK